MAQVAPLISIITICRNAEATIAKTLASVAAQTCAPFEYIIIDGASADRTLELVKACPAVTRWVSEPDNGIADAFNKGLALATGEWVGILNADDWYEPDALQRVLQHVEGADIVHGALRYWEGGSPKETVWPNQNRLPWEMTINHPTVFVRNRIYKEIGGFKTDFRYAMDYEFLLHAWKAGYKFVEVKSGLIANMSFGGASDAHWRKALLEARRAKNSYYPGVVRNTFYWLWQLGRGSLRRGLQALGLEGAVRFARNHFSILKKR